jgi:ubiquinone/menaquinone biosynthesis C-methylase UbiE
MSNFTFDPSRKFLNPEKVLFSVGLGATQTFVDFGSGSGFYTLAAAQIVGDQGAVYSIDILESALEHTSAEARMKGYKNIKTAVCDLEQPHACEGIPGGSADVCLFANIVHQIENRDNLFTEAYRILKTGGKLVVIEWNDQPAPIGPRAVDRISEVEVNNLAKKATFKNGGQLSVDAYHFGLVFIK